MKYLGRTLLAYKIDEMHLLQKSLHFFLKYPLIHIIFDLV